MLGILKAFTKIRMNIDRIIKSVVGQLSLVAVAVVDGGLLLSVFHSLYRSFASLVLRTLRRQDTRELPVPSQNLGVQARQIVETSKLGSFWAPKLNIQHLES